MSLVGGEAGWAQGCGRKGLSGLPVLLEHVPQRLLLEGAGLGQCVGLDQTSARTAPVSVGACIRSWLSLLPGAGHPEGAGHAEAAEDDDGADAVPVHVRVPRPHSVPQELQAHLSSHSSGRGLMGRHADS